MLKRASGSERWFLWFSSIMNIMNLTMRCIKEIIIHCSDTEEGKDFTVADIDVWHRKRGWHCIGYQRRCNQGCMGAG